MEENPFFEKAPPKPRNWFITILQSLVILTSVGIVMYLFVLSPNQVDGPSMEPNFYTGQIYFANRIVQWLNGTQIGKATGFSYQRGDVVVLQIPGYPQFIKRIIAVPGDKIAIRDGQVYLNDSLINEEYLPPAFYTRGGDFLEDGGEAQVIPPGSVFIMGDNRPVSYDSRFLGFIRNDWLKGKVFLRVYPLNTFGLIPTGTIK
jgi:signal peptidase I